MKSQPIAVCATALACFISIIAHAADAPVRLTPLAGSKVRIEGTSSIHDWQVEGTLIGGSVEAGAGFPLAPGLARAEKVDVKAEAFIPVRSLKSIEKDGRPYSESMDNIMYGKLLQPAHPRILYVLDQLTMKSAPQGTNANYEFSATGNLIVAGVTNKISMPVTVSVLDAKRVKISGRTAVKMTDFGIQPPAPAIALGLIKTGDEVKLSFDWIVGQKPSAAAH